MFEEKLKENLIFSLKKHIFWIACMSETARVGSEKLKFNVFCYLLLCKRPVQKASIQKLN